MLPDKSKLDALIREIAEAPAPPRYRCIYLVLDGEHSHLCGAEPGPGRLLLCEEHARQQIRLGQTWRQVDA